MKRYFTLLLLLVVASRAAAVLNVPVQHASNSSNSATVLTKAYTSSLGTAHLLIAVAGCFAGFCDTAAVTSGSNTWTKKLSINHGLEVSIYYVCSSVAGADTVTLTSSGSAFEMHLHIYEFAGLQTTSCPDQQGTATPNGGTTFTATTAGSVSQADELQFGAVSTNGSASAIVGTGNWTSYENTTTTSYVLGTLTSSDISGLSGTQSVTTSVAVAPVFWAGAIVTFKVAAPASGSDLSPIVISKNLRNGRNYAG